MGSMVNEGGSFLRQENDGAWGQTPVVSVPNGYRCSESTTTLPAGGSMSVRVVSVSRAMVM